MHNPVLLTIGAAGTGLAVGGMSLIVLQIVSRKRVVGDSRYEQDRRCRMREMSGVYRWFEPLVDDFRKLDVRKEAIPIAGGSLAKTLETSPQWRDWEVEEFRVTKSIEGILVSLAVFLLVAPTGYLVLAFLLAITLAMIYPSLAGQSLRKQQSRRLKIIRRRLPMVVDQLALMIEAGSNFEESLRTIIEEDTSHPLCRELATIVNAIDAGQTRREALTDFRDRFADDDLSELVVAITKGEELGTPLSVILSGQAEQMRIKRSQWGEKAAAEAEVQIVFPGMLIMIACLIVIIAPILLPAVFNLLSHR